MEKHTPLPWRVVRPKKDRRLIQPPLRIEAGKDDTICVLGFGNIQCKNHDANAPLLAAAPRLLAACELARSRAAAYMGVDNDHNSVEYMHAAEVYHACNAVLKTL